jgi:hypothetical protein
MSETQYATSADIHPACTSALHGSLGPFLCAECAQIRRKEHYAEQKAQVALPAPQGVLRL